GVASWRAASGPGLVAVASLGTAAAAAAVTRLHLLALRAGPLPRLAARHAPVDLEARVSSDPVVHAGKVTGSALHHANTTVPVTATRVRAGPVDARVDQPVLVIALGAGWQSLLPGQRLRVTGVLEPPLPGQQVTAAVVARGPPQQVRAAPVTQRVAGRLRACLRAAVRGLPAD